MKKKYEKYEKKVRKYEYKNIKNLACKNQRNDSVLSAVEISGVTDLEQKELMTLSWSLVCVESHRSNERVNDPAWRFFISHQYLKSQPREVFMMVHSSLS